jgi:hypothetical protein
MIKAAIEKILGLSTPTQITIEGREYINQQMTAIKQPLQSALEITTLTGISDYYKNNPDGIKLPETVVHINSHKVVTVVSKTTDPWIQRHSYLTAATEPKQFGYGRYIPLEDFMIAVQTYFVQNETTQKLLQMVGNLTDETRVKILDDGITQQVQAKTGVRIENIQLPNPIMLAPYRTFNEIAQPESAFVFRLKRSGEKGEGTTAALFDADGGNWQNNAILGVKEWLVLNLPIGTTILA